jgi:hypothetical protein
MNRPIIAVALLALALPLAPSPVAAGAIESACLGSGRPAATRALCSCIDRVAAQTLTWSDQRQAARFFRDPQRAQDVRMSKSERDNAFWDRYRAFASAAEVQCAM